MTIFSPPESARFGWRIGRLTVDELADLDELVAGVRHAFEVEHLDMVILRAPADAVSLPARLAVLEGIRAVPADTLLYWEWSCGSATTPHPTTGIETITALDAIESLVTRVFPGYPNHYAANPLLSADAALAGYCEWAVSLVASGNSSCLVLPGTTTGSVAGFGIVDWAPDIPDVRLAGIVPESRGQGNYRRLVQAIMTMTQSRGLERLRISTQAHNVQPMRTWARLGWRPLRALNTTHLIDEDLLRSK